MRTIAIGSTAMAQAESTGLSRTAKKHPQLTVKRLGEDATESWLFG